MFPPQVQPTKRGYVVSVRTAIEHDYDFVDQVFSLSNVNLASEYKPWNRCSLIVDCNVHALYANQIKAYFDFHHIPVRAVQIEVTEDQKNFSTLLNACEILKGFELLRREPVLVVGGGLTTDVVGFACAIYRRGTPYIRVPTTLVGLVDAAIATKVAVNWDGSKNQLGAFYEPLKTVIDFHFLRSLPLPEIRNGLAEIIKVAACTLPEIVDLLEKHGNELVNTKIAQLDGASDSLVIASELILKESIRGVLEAEMPNPREQQLDRFMFFGHTWSPVLELVAVPTLLHGHAVSIDMCYSASVACVLGYMSESAKIRFLNICSAVGLALDHPALTIDLVKEATKKAIATRNGSIRLPLPLTKLGTHLILSDVPFSVLGKALQEHKATVRSFPRGGIGMDADVSIRVN
ncbi:3-dehydroquinate synthase [Trichoderma camerunense]